MSAIEHNGGNTTGERRDIDGGADIKRRKNEHERKNEKVSMNE